MTHWLIRAGSRGKSGNEVLCKLGLQTVKDETKATVDPSMTQPPSSTQTNINTVVFNRQERRTGIWSCP
jgi:hypothetical protein